MRDTAIIQSATLRQLPQTGQTTVYRAGDDGTCGRSNTG